MHSPVDRFAPSGGAVQAGQKSHWAREEKWVELTIKMRASHLTTSGAERGSHPRRGVETLLAFFFFFCSGSFGLLLPRFPFLALLLVICFFALVWAVNFFWSVLVTRERWDCGRLGGRLSSVRMMLKAVRGISWLMG